MMKRWFLPLAALLLAACGDSSTGVFYTAQYPVVRIEAEVTLNTETSDTGTTPDTGTGTDTGTTDGSETTDGTGTTDGTTPGGSTDGSDSGSADGSGSGEEAPQENPLITTIEEAIVAAAPVQAGGGYTLYFSQYNGGRARVVRTPETEAVTGVFGKDPGKSQFEILFDTEDYICTISSYNDGTALRKVVLEIDLTEQYRTLYPTADIARAVRREYTSATAN